MFKKPTVFVLGAGASWHYGYPTGAELVKRVVAKAKLAAQFFHNSAKSQFADVGTTRPDFVAQGNHQCAPEVMKEQWKAAAHKCDILATRLEEVQPPVIDYFLGVNADIQEVGKLMIAWVILECESDAARLKGNINRLVLEERAKLDEFKDKWCRFVVAKLLSGCNQSADLLANNVTFVTFNYDVSLERSLFASLRHIQMLKMSDITRFLHESRVLHVYGQVTPYAGLGTFDPIPTGLLPVNIGALMEVRLDLNKHYLSFAKMLNTVYAASKTIRTIGPAEKETDAATIQHARRAVVDAECVYILGYGFDDNNSRIIGLDEVTFTKPRPDKLHVMFTNMDNINRVNMKAGTLLFKAANAFSDESSVPQICQHWYCVKSVRDVYGALEYDFDDVEHQ